MFLGGEGEPRENPYRQRKKMEWKKNKKINRFAFPEGNTLACKAKDEIF